MGAREFGTIMLVCSAARSPFEEVWALTPVVP